MPLRFATALCLLVILSAVTFAAENSAQVQARVVYGAAAGQQQRADIDLWISEAVAKCGSPVAQPQTNWIALTGESKRLHSGNGFYIDGKVTEKEGKYQVEIEGCNGGSLDQKATLKPGERRVVNLFGIPGPVNIFVALEAPVSEQAKERAEAMKADAKNFRLELNYNGEQGKPFYRMIVSVPGIIRTRSSPFERVVQVKEDEAIKIIDHLARESFFDKAEDLVNDIKISVFPPTMPGYTMKVLPFYEDLGWGLPMIHRLEALREVLPEHGKKDMDLLLARMSGLRQKWEAEAIQGQKTSFKGWELYVWEEDGQTFFSLMVGTNRLKSDDQIAKSAVKGFDAIKPELDKLKKGESVFLHGRRLLDSPSGALTKPVVEHCKKTGVTIE